jgi:hypothetical protein
MVENVQELFLENKPDPLGDGEPLRNLCVVEELMRTVKVKQRSERTGRRVRRYVGLIRATAAGPHKILRIDQIDVSGARYEDKRRSHSAVVSALLHSELHRRRRNH